MFRNLFITALLVGGALVTLTVYGNVKKSAQEVSVRENLYEKYGGYPTVMKLANDLGNALLVDPITAPYFGVVGTPGHVTPDRLLSCLDLQLVSLLGGPTVYPGRSKFRNAPPEGYQCLSMRKIHKGLNISEEAWNRFLMIAVDVLKANGVEQHDIHQIAPILIGMKEDVVGL
ncbi:group 1 truncated hemoglobin [Bdellovibrio sp. 22V]|uniref:group I truncated hemoglobin n=1 Tax=Bdellovibrio TaxID=958 RepID=UPI002542A57A|nr:group 1 truncated hemoglobin [Bdellovibrio sp. 22V]WII73853.1 group 1 truncated hemoglobin [Bdellovibrio sp. 22V]